METKDVAIQSSEKSKYKPKRICLGLELILVSPWHHIEGDDFVFCEFNHGCGIWSVRCLVVWFRNTRWATVVYNAPLSGKQSGFGRFL